APARERWRRDSSKRRRSDGASSLWRLEPTTTIVDRPTFRQYPTIDLVQTGTMDEFVLGDRELDVMGVLWDLGSGTVSEVRERLPADLAYTTVLTILRNLEAKELVRHTA